MAQTTLYEARAYLNGKDKEPEKRYFDTREKAELWLSDMDDGEIGRITFESAEVLGYYDGCTYDEMMLLIDSMEQKKD
ncbi:MAG: hypothetical protein IKS98_08170 [Lachnospiraceae bacterium]|nr:hypothetical protein [Lachnospiraceae bacterium]